MSDQFTGPESDQKYESFNSVHNERVNFRNHLFLQEDDFTREQMYHQAHRYKINETLHGFGIVWASSETDKVLPLWPNNIVVSDTIKCQLTAGMAFDHKGREIIVSKDKETDDHIVNKEGDVGTSWFLYLNYAEKVDHDDPEKPENKVRSYEPSVSGEAKTVVPELIRDGFTLHATSNPAILDSESAVLLGYYTSGSIADLYNGEPVRTYIKSLQQIQDDVAIVEHKGGYVLHDHKDGKEKVGLHAVDLTISANTANDEQPQGATGAHSFAQGFETIAMGAHAVATGQSTKALETGSFSQGQYTEAQNYASHAEGYSTFAEGQRSHAEGQGTHAVGMASHAEGKSTYANGEFSHAEGDSSTAGGDWSHAEGNSQTGENAKYAHAEGASIANGESSHSEGVGTTAGAKGSHAEGSSSNAIGEYSHAEGNSTKAKGKYSHTEGNSTETSEGADYAHAEGLGTIANNKGMHVSGKYNNYTDKTDIFQIGAGISTKRENAFEVSDSGKLVAPMQNGQIELEDDLITLKYLKENSMNADFRPHLNGFAYPDAVILTYDDATSKATISLKDEYTVLNEHGMYFVQGEKYILSQLKNNVFEVSTALTVGMNHLFIAGDSAQKLVVAKSWDDADDGLLPLLTVYKAPTDGDIGTRTISITPDYHGSTMDTSTRDFINENNGMWISWGLAANAYSKYTLDREQGALVNDDVYHPIASQNGVQNDRVRPALWGMINSGWTTEQFKEFYKPLEYDWLGYISQPGTYYQDLSEDNPSNATLLRGTGDYGEAKGGWFLYFVRPDLRTVVDAQGNVSNAHDDVFIPLTISCDKAERFEGLDKSVRDIANHYKSVICDWKALGLIFIQDAKMEDYVNISHLELKDLLYGNITECINTLEDDNVHTVRPSLNGFLEPERVTITYTEDPHSSDPQDTVRFERVAGNNTTYYSSDYYSDGKRYKLIEEQQLAISGSFKHGINHVFLMEDSKLKVTQTWEAGGGYLPILTVYKDRVIDGISLNTISVTPDYHGTTMDSSTRDFINENNGLWINWGLYANNYESNNLQRENGVVVNEDVHHEIEARNGSGNYVYPQLLFLEDARWENEKVKQEFAGGNSSWLSTLCPSGCALYQEIDYVNYLPQAGRLKPVSSSGYGAWYLYFVRPDMRAGTTNSDVFIPLTVERTLENRFSDLGKPINDIANHYKGLICDWKVLGMIFVQDGSIKDYVNIANFELKDLLYGNAVDVYMSSLIEPGYNNIPGSSGDIIVSDGDGYINSDNTLRISGNTVIASDTIQAETAGTNPLTLVNQGNLNLRLGTVANLHSEDNDRMITTYDPDGNLQQLVRTHAWSLPDGPNQVKSLAGPTYYVTIPANQQAPMLQINNDGSISAPCCANTSITFPDDLVTLDFLINRYTGAPSAAPVSTTKPDALAISSMPSGLEGWNGTYRLQASGHYKMDGVEKYIGNGHGPAVWVFGTTGSTPYYSGTPYVVDNWPGASRTTWNYYQNGSMLSCTLGIEINPDTTEEFQAVPAPPASPEEDTGAYNFVRADNGFFAKDKLKMDWNTTSNRAELEVMTAEANNGMAVVSAGTEKLVVDSAGTVTAPTATTGNIDVNSKALITKEYADAHYTNAPSSGGATKLTYGYSRSASWNNGSNFGPNGANDINGNCAHIMFEAGTITKLGYFFEGLNAAAIISVYKNEAPVYTSVSIANGTNVHGLLTGLNITVAEGDRIRLNISAGGQRGQMTLIVEG